VKRKRKQQGKLIPPYHVITQLDISTDPLLILLPFMKWLNSEERDRLNIREVCTSLVEGHEIDREKWLRIIHRGCHCTVDLTGSPIVEIISADALNAICLLIIEGDSYWRERFRRCEWYKCKKFFLVQRGKLRGYCTTKHENAHRQERYRKRDIGRVRRRQREHFERFIIKEKPWIKK